MSSHVNTMVYHTSITLFFKSLLTLLSSLAIGELERDRITETDHI